MFLDVEEQSADFIKHTCSDGGRLEKNFVFAAFHNVKLSAIPVFHSGVDPWYINDPFIAADIGCAG